METVFQKGDQVQLKNDRLVGSLFKDQIYVIGAVKNLFLPSHYYIDPNYWGCSKWEWARNKTRLQVAGHSQVVFLDGVLRPKIDIPSMNEDPEGKGRAAFSGVWFEKISS